MIMKTDQKREIGRQREKKRSGRDIEREGKQGQRNGGQRWRDREFLVNLSHQCVPNEEITGDIVSKNLSDSSAYRCVRMRTHTRPNLKVISCHFCSKVPSFLSSLRSCVMS